MSLEDKIAALTAAVEANTAALTAAAGNGAAAGATGSRQGKKDKEPAASPAPAAPTLTAVDVREIMKNCTPAQVKALLAKESPAGHPYSPDGKLSTVKAEDFAALIADAKAALAAPAAPVEAEDPLLS